MELEFTYDEEGKHVLCRVTGHYEFAVAEKIGKCVAEECAKRDCKRALVDVRLVTGDVSQMDRYQLGQAAAAAWGMTLRVALVAPAWMVNRFFEDVAVNRMADVRIFTDPEVAVRWLATGKDERVTKS